MGLGSVVSLDSEPIVDINSSNEQVQPARY